MERRFAAILAADVVGWGISGPASGMVLTSACSQIRATAGNEIGTLILWQFPVSMR